MAWVLDNDFSGVWYSFSEEHQEEFRTWRVIKLIRRDLKAPEFAIKIGNPRNIRFDNPSIQIISGL